MCQVSVLERHLYKTKSLNFRMDDTTMQLNRLLDDKFREKGLRVRNNNIH